MSSIDVIVPCYRYGHFLRECVESVLAQGIQDIRVLVIDDASPDNTFEVAEGLSRADSRVVVRRHVNNLGHIATYNEGLEWTSADYLLLLSADDYLLPGSLSRAAGLMDRHPEVGFTFGNVMELSGEGLRHVSTPANASTRAAYRILSGSEFIELSGARNIVPTPTAVVRTKLQKLVGGYRPELPHSGDMEMWLRLAAHGAAGVFQARQAVYRRHGKNMSLGFTEENWLRDLQQRNAAIDSFVLCCEKVLPRPNELRAGLLRSLACEAIGFASEAFNEAEMDVSHRLSQFALTICPEVTKSWSWRKLSCKRGLGLKRWRAIKWVADLLRGRLATRASEQRVAN